MAGKQRKRESFETSDAGKKREKDRDLIGPLCPILGPHIITRFSLICNLVLRPAEDPKHTRTFETRMPWDFFWLCLS